MDSVWREIEELRVAPMVHILARYRELFQEEPRSKHRQHLFRRLAWRLQALEKGGLNEAARQRADAIANDADIRVLPPRGVFIPHSAGAQETGPARSRFDPRIPRCGTVLKREYGGRTIVVKVLASGFEYESRIYGSLSAIATEVTGTRWNGLAFFGLLARSRRTTKGGSHV